MDEEMSRLMRLPDAEFHRVLLAEDAAAKAARAARATAAPAPRSFVGVAQRKDTASSGESQRWLESMIARYGERWQQYA